MKTFKLLALIIALSAITPIYSIASNENNDNLSEIVTEYKKYYPNFQFYPFDETELEWNEFKEKKSSSLIKKNTLVLENDGLTTPVSTYTELPININRDFCIYTTILVPKFDEETNYNFIINMDDTKNKGIITVNPSKVTYELYKNGDKVYEQTAMINGKVGKNQTITLVIEKKVGKILVSVNGDQCLKLRKIEYKNTGFGYLASENQKITVTEIACGTGREPTK